MPTSTGRLSVTYTPRILLMLAREVEMEWEIR
jgi:hypothetical protein